MALEIVASALFGALFEKMASPEVLSYFRKKKFDDHELRNLLLAADKVLDDAEDKQLTDPHVRQWLRNLKAATFDVEDLLVEICDDGLCPKMERESASVASKVIKLMRPLCSCTAFEKDVEQTKEEILNRLKLVLKGKDVFDLRESDVARSVLQRSEATSVVEESEVYGRDSWKREIVKLLLSNEDGEDRISVIPIVGMGGIGKTTLAGLVYNDDNVKKHFEVKEWVTVSDDFNVARITKTILDRIDHSRARDIGDLDRLQVELMEALREKKFFFVLDDIWEENYVKWDGLRRAFGSGAKGSNIIVTTRNERIASMMANAGGISPRRLGTISNKDCLQLFGKHAFGRSDALCSNPRMEMIGKKVVERCKGLPLAVKSLAGLLRSVSEAEWENILNSDIWERELSRERVEIVPALWLSYHYLPPHLKRCFAYCAIFPQDYRFGKQELILLWVAEDLLPHQKDKRPEDVGEEYFNDLLSRSMFQRSGYYEAFGESFNMHDLVRDLAKYVSGEFCAFLEDNDSNTSLSNIARHLSFGKEVIFDIKKFEALWQAKYLRTFLAFPCQDGNWERLSSSLPLYETLPPELLFNALSLRVLSLRGHPSTELPDSIGDLKRLRYLDISYSTLERLPNTVCNLYNLQILLLSSCKKLAQLPSKMGGLINLRHLDVRETPLKNMPEDLGSLKNLEFLSDFVVGEDNGSNIKQLEKLHHLHGKLRISGLHNIGDVMGILESRLRDMKHLNELVLDFAWDGTNSEREIQLLDSLQPQAKLKKLDIESYGGERFSNWLGDNSFSNMTTVSLSGCHNCRSLPPLGQLVSLKELNISGFGKLVKIGEEFFGNATSSTNQAFRSLETLRFESMLSWNEWSFRRADGEGGVFPSLTRLELRYCTQLVKLISGAPQHERHTPFPSLTRLQVYDCTQLVKLISGAPQHERHTPFPSLTRLQVYDCTQLVKLISGAPQHEKHTPFPSLQNIELLRCFRLESFLEWGSFTKLESITIRGCVKLFQWDLQRFTSLKSLSLWGFNDWVDAFPEEGLLPTTLTSLKIRQFERLKALNGKGLQQLTSLESLQIEFCEKLECLPEEGLPNSLSFLKIKYCPLLEERCERERGEDWSKIAHISNVVITS